MDGFEKNGKKDGSFWLFSAPLRKMLIRKKDADKKERQGGKKCQNSITQTRYTSHFPNFTLFRRVTKHQFPQDGLSATIAQALFEVVATSAFLGIR